MKITFFSKTRVRHHFSAESSKVAHYFLELYDYDFISLFIYSLDMDAFGRSYKRANVSGLRGKTGSSGLDVISSLMPNTLLNNLQTYDEECCFFINNLTQDVLIKEGSIQEWISRTKNKRNLLIEKPCHGTEKIETNRYAIIFNKTLFINNDIFFLPNYADTFGFVCITFQVEGGNEQTLISNYKKQMKNFGKFKCLIIT